jgi:hypothetical protein
MGSVDFSAHYSGLRPLAQAGNRNGACLREGSRDAPGECEILEALPSACGKSILPAPFPQSKKKT